MKLAILHAGQPKTGSSSLQNYLAANDTALRAQGILYPRTDRENGVTQHGAIMRALAGKSRLRMASDLPVKLAEEIERTPHEVLLLSAEFLASPLFFRPHPPVWHFFLRRGYAIETVSYVRDQPDFLNSAYVQLVKTGREGRGFDAFLAARLAETDKGPKHNTDLIAYLAPRARRWGRHSFLPYSGEVRARGVEADFMAALRRVLDQHGLAPGLTEAVWSGFTIPARVNESDGPVHVAAGRAIARGLEERFRGRRLFFVTRGVHDAIAEAIAALGLRESRYSALTPERYRLLRVAHRKVNNRFARDVWGRPWAELFPSRPRTELQSNDIDDTRDPEQLELLAAVLARAQPVIEAQVAGYEAKLARRA
ncbi:MAG TPA: hypothetical protein VFR34_00990 [Paracoccaceae bacterium]|nr:hypothetical protein [Paracoccaceae bacterium]